ncbi:hypothetical protein [Lacinutrix chionoecetis]
MKSKKILQLVMVGVFMLILSSFTAASDSITAKQGAITINAVYDGFEEYGYNFITNNDDDEERTMTFQFADDTVLEAFDLKSDALIGKAMKVTYTTAVETEEDEDGFDLETEVLTITKLEILK